MNLDSKNNKRNKRRRRIRSKVFGTSSRPRLSVFKSNRYIVLQIVDDSFGNTLAYVSTREIEAKTPKMRAFEAGKKIAGLAIKSNINKVVFDRGGYTYTGSVKMVAEGAREGGLDF